MKKIITMLLSCVLLATSAMAQQKVVKDANGNYSPAKVAVSGVALDKPTGSTYTDSKGVKYPVYKSVNGNLYIIRTSRKTGNTYKQYLKL